MDAIRSLLGVGMAHLMVLSAVAPASAELNENPEKHRRPHGRGHAVHVTHVRHDYPVILAWLESPEDRQSDQTATE